MTHALKSAEPSHPPAAARLRLGAEAVFRRLLHVSKALAGQLDVQTAIQVVSEELAHILPHDHLDVCILRSDQHVAYEAGAHTDGSLHERPLPVVGSPIRLVHLGEAPFLLTGDAMRDPRFKMTLADLARILRRVGRLRAAGSLEPDILEPLAGLDRCIRELREIVDDARPSVLQLFGLADGIEDFLVRALDASGASIASRFRNESEGCVDRLEDRCASRSSTSFRRR